MNNCLYIICPTDHLEPLVRKWFEGQKYFYTSLGNTLTIDKNTLAQIAITINRHNINKITFILSEENSIVLDALNNQKFSTITGLKESYKSIIEQKREALNLWNTHNQHTLFLSYYLNQKIKDLQSRLKEHLSNPPNINGKLYSKPYNSFRNIYSHLICLNAAHIN